LKTQRVATRENQKDSIIVGEDFFELLDVVVLDLLHEGFALKI